MYSTIRCAPALKRHGIVVVPFIDKSKTIERVVLSLMARSVERILRSDFFNQQFQFGSAHALLSPDGASAARLNLLCQNVDETVSHVIFSFWRGQIPLAAWQAISACLPMISQLSSLLCMLSVYHKLCVMPSIQSDLFP